MWPSALFCRCYFSSRVEFFRCPRSYRLSASWRNVKALPFPETLNHHGKYLTEGFQGVPDCRPLRNIAVWFSPIFNFLAELSQYMMTMGRRYPQRYFPLSNHNFPIDLETNGVPIIYPNTRINRFIIPFKSKGKLS